MKIRGCKSDEEGGAWGDEGVYIYLPIAAELVSPAYSVFDIGIQSLMDIRVSVESTIFVERLGCQLRSLIQTSGLYRNENYQTKESTR